MIKNNQKAFLELVRAGLWGTEVQLSSYGKIDFSNILQLANEQGVTGLVAAGLEHVTDVKIQKTDVLQFVGQTIQIERRNKLMNQFVAELVEKMRDAGICAILVKGQGVAQCYEKPLWRPSGDIDFLLNSENYEKAKMLLLPLSNGNKQEERYSRHLGMNMGKWYVEIHGSLRTGLAASVDKEVDAVQDNVFIGGNVRSWDNGGVPVFLPAPTEDVFFVFTHFIKHFYKEGMTLRQVCDWCRLLWTYRSEINVDWLEPHLRKAGLMNEWNAFALLAVEYLGMPVEMMPLFNVRSKKDEVRGKMLAVYILGEYSGNKMKDTLQIAKIFPWKVLRYAPSIFLNMNWLKVKERLLLI